jgi:non-heme chloroperoxidase
MSFLTARDGCRLRISDRGAGQAILLVHGWKMSHRVFDHTTAGLVDRFRVVAFDLRGMGESDKPGGPYDFDVFAEDLELVMESLELERVTLVGWSMGCSVALQHLSRDGDRVAGLVLVNGPIRLTQAEDFPWTMTEAEVDGYIRGVAERWPTEERDFTRAGLRVPDDDVVDWIFHIALQTPLDVVLAAVRQQVALDFRELLPRLNIPVLALYGRHDPFYPVELGAYIADQAPRGAHRILEHSAHFPFIEEADQFNALVAQFALGLTTRA